MNEPAKQPLELPAATYEPQLSASIDLERCLSREVLLHVIDLSGTHEVKTCYKRYDADVFTGVNCRTAAVFQFHSAALRRLNKVGCQRYEGDYTRLKQKHAERRARRMAG